MTDTINEGKCVFRRVFADLFRVVKNAKHSNSQVENICARTYSVRLYMDNRYVMRASFKNIPNNWRIWADGSKQLWCIWARTTKASVSKKMKNK